MNQKPLNRFIKVDFICDKCQKEFQGDIVYSLAPNLDQLNHYHTYCVHCKEIITNEETEEENDISPLIRKKKSDKPCSFFLNDQPNEIIACDKPVFDKKKQLCQSHNKQVWKKFHEFTKDKSTGSTAAWLAIWDQSGDWRYFWNLGKKKRKERGLTEPLLGKKALKNPLSEKKQKNWGTAPIHETTENLQSLNIDKRSLKKTGRIHLFATRMKKEWIEQLKSIAYEERLHYNELLEKALLCYEKHRKRI
ncbi:MAG: hypothetical protein MRECE_2c052 [Mycoplasmataceae bacterium CE_OT135]|nr:MAG: hypothetical protein MRECE_2c052 [Mycoplasmataceae bacterium CE_OT135]